MCDLKLEISKFQEISNASMHTDLNFEWNLGYSTTTKRKKKISIENNLLFIDFDNFVTCYREKDFPYIYIYSLIFSRFFANLKKKNNLIIFQQHISIKKKVI